MEKIVYILNQLKTVLDVDSVHLSAQGDVLAATCEVNAHMEQLLKQACTDLSERSDRAEAMQQIPHLLPVEKNIYFWYFALPDNSICLFGPAGGEFLTSNQVQAFLHHYHYGQLSVNIPRYSIVKLLSVMSMSCYMVSGQQYDEECIRRSNAGNMAVSEADVVDYQIYRYNEDTTRRTYASERLWLDAIESGDAVSLNAEHLSETDLQSVYKGVGVMADNDFKQAEYMVVSCVTLATRAAVRGGVPPFAAYEISDLFLQKTAKCENVLALMDIVTQVPERFAGLVSEFKVQNRRNIMVEQCKEYIARNLYRKFTLTEMSAAFGVNRTYLSQLFSGQTGQTLQQYVRDSRLQAAANLLKYSEESVGQIAEYMQFSSAGRFCGYFKTMYGMTPVQYREKNKVIDFVSKK